MKKVNTYFPYFGFLMTVCLETHLCPIRLCAQFFSMHMSIFLRDKKDIKRMKPVCEIFLLFRPQSIAEKGASALPPICAVCCLALEVTKISTSKTAFTHLPF